MKPPSVLLLDSVTDTDSASAGQVLVCGSHGGLYAAYRASQAQVHAVVLNDAGIGLNDAGVAGVLALADAGMAAATAGHRSCRIGSAQDAWDNGVISVVNTEARALGVCQGMSVTAAAELMLQARKPAGLLAEVGEGRWRCGLTGLAIEEPMTVGSDTNAAETNASAAMAGSAARGNELLLVDSASLVGPADAGRIIITGSHGGLIGNDPARALKVRAAIAVFNDAGGGKAQAGLTRLPVLDQQGIAAVTVSHNTARIGDARSTLETGVISHVNRLATERGATAGLSLADWLASKTILAHETVSGRRVDSIE